MDNGNTLLNNSNGTAYIPGTPNQAPIGGLGALAVAGGALALKKLWNKRKGN